MISISQDCYTIGHSTHSLDHFLKLLDMHSINYLVDIRSIPFSAYVSHFNKDNLTKVLSNNDIAYLFMGDILGARPNDVNMFDTERRVDFIKVRQTDNFIRGIQRVINGLQKGYKICLMCSEANPYDCHRTILVGYSLAKEGIIIRHILPNGEIKYHSQIEEELTNRYFPNRNQLNLFETDGFCDQRGYLEKAYDLRGKEIAYREEME